jgi:hypothetical protein
MHQSNIVRIKFYKNQINRKRSIKLINVYNLPQSNTIDEYYPVGK